MLIDGQHRVEKALMLGKGFLFLQEIVGIFKEYHNANTAAFIFSSLK